MLLTGSSLYSHFTREIFDLGPFPETFPLHMCVRLQGGACMPQPKDHNEFFKEIITCYAQGN